MDYDGDGHLDIVSGSYDPGAIYLFRGRGKGKFLRRRTITDEAGLPLVHDPVGMVRQREMTALPSAERDQDEYVRARVSTFGSWPSLVDWDADGDLDVVIGSFGGQLLRRENIGSAEKPVWAKAAHPVLAAGEQLSVNRHAAPAAADWDGDGLFDLVLGVSDGSVGWFRNEGEVGKPVFGAWQLLVEPAAKHKFLRQGSSPGRPARPGVRAQIHVCDYDGDGQMDLLVGDYRKLQPLRVMSDEEWAVRRKLEAQHAAIQNRIWALDAGEQKSAAGLALALELKTLLAKLDQDNEGEERRASYVWLFRRLPAEGTESPAEEKGKAPGAPSPPQRGKGGSGPQDAFVSVALAQLDRRLSKQPAELLDPRYCLWVFGQRAQVRMWAILDKSSAEAPHYDTLYLDRNGNGDLTEKGERFVGKSSAKGAAAGMGMVITVGDLPVPGTDTVHRKVRVSTAGKKKGDDGGLLIMEWKGEHELMGGYPRATTGRPPWGRSTADAPIWRPNPTAPLSFGFWTWGAEAVVLDRGRKEGASLSLLAGAAGHGSHSLMVVDEHFLDLKIEVLSAELLAKNAAGEELRSKTRITEHC